MNYLFTSESVSEGHPDKVADQISDAILDEFLAYDPQSKVACETLVTTGQVVVAGEVKSEAYIDLMDVTRRVINGIGYDRSELKFDGDACGVLSALHEQSADINRGVERENIENQGAGDQGMMFGYACNETANYLPLTLDLSHLLLKELSEIRREGKVMTYLRPDSKSQVTVEYTSEGKPVRVHTIVVSTQHDDFIKPCEGKTQEQADEEMLAIIKNDVATILVPRVIALLSEETKALFDGNYILRDGQITVHLECVVGFRRCHSLQRSVGIEVCHTDSAVGAVVISIFAIFSEGACIDMVACGNRNRNGPYIICG